ANSDDFPDYGAINAGAPININDKSPGYVGPPYINSLEDRHRFQLRARLGVKAQIANWISADIRVATGNGRSPISTNQTLGGGGTSNYSLWLDRASIRLSPVKDVAIDLGRFANPFWSSDLVFDNDMNFDGVAISAKGAVTDGVRLFGTLGAFPVFNTDLNFGSQNAPILIDPETGAEIPTGRPFKSEDKYLFAAQAGVEFRPSEQVSVKLAGAYFHFDNVEGKVSEPCYWDELVCSTDITRPAFQQFGNTMFPIRNIIGNPNNLPQSPDNQYFGLASKYEILHVRGQVEYKPNDGFGVRLEGDYVKNLGWDRSSLMARAVNNLGPQSTIPDPDNSNGTLTVDGPYEGGDSGWQARLTVGSVLNLNGLGDWQAKRGDWNAHVAYRRLASDAVIDGFADSDFHIGGTNNRGWQIGGNYAIAKNTIFGLRWISAEEVAGAPFSVDRGFIDLVTKF
ncbi:MAG: putative porin, partial [Sphingobium sp.]